VAGVAVRFCYVALRAYIGIILKYLQQNMHPFVNDFGGFGGVCDHPLIKKKSLGHNATFHGMISEMSESFIFFSGSKP
jgi:hypothetical protein